MKRMKGMKGGDNGIVFETHFGDFMGVVVIKWWNCLILGVLFCRKRIINPD
jgi:hypothetical protein